jgi:hypothetical protein
MTRLLTVTAVLLFSTGCGKSAVGEDCTQSSQCAEGTSCIQYGGQDIVNGTLACQGNLVCSIACNQDAQCASLGTGYICVGDCFAGSCLKGSRG